MSKSGLFFRTATKPCACCQNTKLVQYCPIHPFEKRKNHNKKDAWIGTGAVILPDITIGEGSIIGANSVVIRDVPPHTVYAGVPAKFIKSTIPDKKLFKVNMR
jgi:serine acetyltransferase